MSEKYKFIDPHGLYFTTSTIVDWIDLFSRKEFRYIVLDSLRYCQTHKGLKIHAWCLMSSHLHMIISSDLGNLSDIMRDFKKHTAKRIIAEMDIINESRRKWLKEAFAAAGKDLKRIKNFKVWKDGNHPKCIETIYFLEQKLDYIHNNPVENELVDEPEYYIYSSARDYQGRQGMLKVELLY